MSDFTNHFTFTTPTKLPSGGVAYSLVCPPATDIVATVVSHREKWYVLRCCNDLQELNPMIIGIMYGDESQAMAWFDTETQARLCAIGYAMTNDLVLCGKSSDNVSCWEGINAVAQGLQIGCTAVGPGGPLFWQDGNFVGPV